jgi:hypothetical protein
MFIDEHVFFVSVGTPIALTMVVYLGTKAPGARATAQIRDALQAHVNVYKAAQFNVMRLSTDGEGGMDAAVPLLAKLGITVNQVGAGEHVHIIENKIKTIKERVRSILHSLPFSLPTALTKWLVMYSVYVINCVPNMGGYPMISPREALTGRKMVVKRDLPVSFGDYCQIARPKTDNTMKARTEAAIALLPAGNQQGTVKFLNLETGKTCRRDQFTILPFTQEVINALNKMSANSSAVALEEEKQQDAPEEPNPFLPPQREVGVVDPTQQLERLEWQEIAAEEPATVEPDSSDPSPPPAEPVPEKESSHSMSLRTRPETPYVRHAYATGNYTITQGVRDPVSRIRAVEALAKELLQLVEKGVFVGARRADVREGDSVIPSKTFLKDKRGPDGEFLITKARFVAGGHRQDRSLYEDVSSPTASVLAVYYVAAMAAREGRCVKVCDIAGAYLNAKMDEAHRVFIKMGNVEAAVITAIDPKYKKFVNEDGTLLLRLLRALYGCIESARLWYQELAKALEEEGFKANDVEPCVFNKTINGLQITVVVYVDDLLIASQSAKDVDEFLNMLRRRFVSITVHEGDVIPYLGMKFDFSEKGR